MLVWRNQQSVSLVLRQAVQGTTSEHAGLPSKHISQRFKPIQMIRLMSSDDNKEGFVHLFHRCSVLIA